MFQMNEGSGESSSGRARDARNRADYGERAGTAYSTRNERSHFDRNQFTNYDRGGYQPNRGFRGDGFHFRGQQRGFDNANQRNGPRKPFFDSKRIPDRWMNYDGVGCDMEGTRFLPFKTPLDRSFFVGKPNIHEDEHFDVDSLIRLARENGKRIGLVIDLTNTSRYYDKTDWEKHDVQYVKLNCPGHEVDGRDDIVEKFNTIVEDFVTNSENDGNLIGVHCTHGLNRTGYLICRLFFTKKISK
ncbi:hypothetical protein WR25_03520 [Diploscapter pachys]|uniref:Tyrosine specific protein phosphatases domain-containing protein n=1 Tax=Diploscapter pachys TaxID=2018661 RepID=A0A2A2JCM5_9BILA|nr:hypothetical protein WR25_03520 [Diploscapter pachys]